MYHLYHFRKDITNKYLKIYEKGPLVPESITERNRAIDKDYAELTTTLEKMVRFYIPDDWNNICVCKNIVV